MSIPQAAFSENLQFLKQHAIDLPKLPATREFIAIGRRFIPLTSSILICGAVAGIVIFVVAATLHHLALSASGLALSMASGLCVYEIRKLDDLIQTYQGLVGQVAKRVRKLNEDLEAQTSLANQVLRLTEQVIALREENKNLREKNS